MRRFENRRVVVTGGAKGIGRAIADGFASEGAALALVGRDEAAGAEACAALANAGARALFVRADLADPPAAERAVAQSAERLGGLDVLVANAAFSRRRGLADASLEDWREMLDVNLIAPFFAARACEGRMGAGGAIVTIASEMHALANPQSIVYGTTKAALVHLTRKLALHFAPAGIRVVSVAPGPIRTEMLERSVVQAGQPLEEGLAAHAARLPIGRLGTPEEVAQAVLYLASPQAGFVTGTVLAIDGGSTIPHP